MAFQNSHFSLAYDRPSITMVSQPEIPFDPESMPGHRSYFETLCRVVSLALDILRGRMLSDHSHLRHHEIRDYQHRMQRILAETTPHLRHRDACVTLADHIERCELRLHSSYLVSVMCRVSLDPDSHLDPHRRALIREQCIENLINTIAAFVELHSINPHSSRSWISLQRTIASAFLLVAKKDGQANPQTRSLIDNLESVLADHVSADGASAHNGRTDSAKHLSSSLRALREVSAAFRQTPRPPAQPQQPQHPQPVQPQGQPQPSSAPRVHPVVLPAQVKTAHPPPGMPPYYRHREDGDVRNILDTVSEVMLFPSMSGAES